MLILHFSIHFGITTDELLKCGALETSEQANKMAKAAMSDPSIALNGRIDNAFYGSSI